MIHSYDIIYCLSICVFSINVSSISRKMHLSFLSITLPCVSHSKGFFDIMATPLALVESSAIKISVFQSITSQHVPSVSCSIRTSVPLLFVISYSFSLLSGFLLLLALRGSILTSFLRQHFTHFSVHTYIYKCLIFDLKHIPSTAKKVISTHLKYLSSYFYTPILAISQR